ncbi:MAG: hypothetical protein JHC87_06010, partial [Thermoleophilaceae bacterium]|nr:hypothetical protein [Thermoleophilaceae bacterium]
IGALIVFAHDISQRALGLIMAFGAGVLISAVAYELVEEAFNTSDGAGVVAIGLLIGAVTFTVGDYLIDRSGGAQRKQSVIEGGMGETNSGLAITLGIVLDGVPESIIIGLGLLAGNGIGVAVVVAVFISNIPEGIAASKGLLSSGWTRARLTLMWLGVALVAGVASMLGYGAFDDASNNLIAAMLAFAGGAVLTMLADTMMPEAFKYGGKLVGLITTVGFALSFAISSWA